MEPAEGLALDKVRCAEAHAAQEADPAGTAPVWDAVLAVEIPGPWPKDISLVEPFATPAGSKVATITGADGRAWRPQGLLCDKDCDWRTVIAFERPHPGSGPFLRREWLMPASDPPATAALVGALLAGDQDAVAVHDDRRQDPPEGTVDLLLCTHGSRDVCCGGPGTALFGEVVQALGGSDVEGPHGRCRIWRTSHAGGHRFAPTALSFPEGVSWAHLGESECTEVLCRGERTAELSRHMRGSVTVAAGVAQVADREGFARFGWDWLDSERKAVLAAHDRVTLASTVDVVVAPAVHGGSGPSAGMEAAVTVEVSLERHISMPTCGAVSGPEFATEPVWHVETVEVAG